MTRTAHRNRQSPPLPSARPAAAVARQVKLARYARAGFLLPALVYVLFAFAVPIVYNLILSFEQTSPAE